MKHKIKRVDGQTSKHMSDGDTNTENDIGAVNSSELVNPLDEVCVPYAHILRHLNTLKCTQ